MCNHVQRLSCKAPAPASTADADSAFETQRAKLEARFGPPFAPLRHVPDCRSRKGEEAIMTGIGPILTRPTTKRSYSGLKKSTRRFGNLAACARRHWFHEPRGVFGPCHAPQRKSSGRSSQTLNAGVMRKLSSWPWKWRGRVPPWYGTLLSKHFQKSICKLLTEMDADSHQEEPCGC